MLYGHGDNGYVYGREILADFSSNVWYGGEPPGLKDHLFRQWDRINRYPEVLAESLAPVIARHHGLDGDQILVTAGTTESIYLLAQLYSNNERTGIVIPAFSEYEDACRIHGHQLHFLPQPSPSSNPAASLLWIGNPNNPTGAVFPSIASWVRQHPETLFIVDEAFIEFTNAIPSSIGDVADLSNLVILRSLTKAFAIPGLRLGYIAASPVLIEKLKALKMPWSVNSMALAAGHYIFDHYGNLSLPLATLLSDRVAFTQRLREIPIKVTTSHTHFFCCETPTGTAGELKKYLLDHHGILIRDAANFRGLSARHFRLATGSPDRNLLLINAVQAWRQLPV